MNIVGKDMRKKNKNRRDNKIFFKFIISTF